MAFSNCGGNTLAGEAERNLFFASSALDTVDRDPLERFVEVF
jgi:hypothetical protein